MLINGNYWYSGDLDHSKVEEDFDPGLYRVAESYSAHFSIAVCGVIGAIVMILLAVSGSPLWLLGPIPLLILSHRMWQAGKASKATYLQINAQLTKQDIANPWHDQGAWGLLHRHLYLRYMQHYNIPLRDDSTWAAPRKHYWELIERHRGTINGFLRNQVVASALQSIANPDIDDDDKEATTEALEDYAEHFADGIWEIETARQQVERGTVGILSAYAVQDLMAESTGESPALTT